MAYDSDLVRTKDWTSEVLTDSDLEGQFDLIINWVMASLEASTGHKHTGAANQAPKIPLTTSVTGTLPVTNGGTGQATLAAFLNLIYPVGSYYFNDSDSTNPGTLLGFGTWVAVEECVLVGYKSGSAEFGTAGGTYGAKTITLTAAQSGVPAHDHAVLPQGAGSSPGVGNFLQGATDDANYGSLNTGNNTAANAAEAHSNIQPSRTVYIWRRTV